MRRLILIILLALSVMAPLKAQTIHVMADSDSVSVLGGNWIQQLYYSGFSLTDPRVKMPKFPRFVADAYLKVNGWLNPYDPTYVVSTGKSFKLSLTNQNWAQAYAYVFDIQRDAEGSAGSSIESINILTRPDSEIGLNLTVLGLTLGYTWHLNSLIGTKRDRQNTFNFAVDCARFSIDFQTWRTTTKGYITRLGNFGLSDINRHVPIDERFLSASLCYYFNNTRYSPTAPYLVSRYQLRSAGSWLIGVNYRQQNIRVDLSGLPANILDSFPGIIETQFFRFHDYEIRGGYARNICLPHGWLFNFVAAPSIGYRHINKQETSILQKFATGLHGRFAFTYNHKLFFATLQGRTDFAFDFTGRYTFLNSASSLTGQVGIRF